MFSRIVCRGKHLDHTNPMFYKMHALKSFDLINLKTAVVMYKAYNNILPVNLQKLFVHFVAIRKTRHVNIQVFKAIYKENCILNYI